jgi:WD40 repeat protein
VPHSDSLFELSGRADPVSSAAFSPDGSRILTHGSDQTARVRDAAAGRRGCAPAAGRCRVFNPEGFVILEGSGESPPRLWNPATGASGPVLEAFVPGASRAASSPSPETSA